MISLRFTFILTIFVLGFSRVFTQMKPEIHYFVYYNISDSIIQVYDPIYDYTYDYPYSNKTILKMLNGSIEQATKSKIETHGAYKFITYNSKNTTISDTLEQVFLAVNLTFSLELNFGIINTISENSDLKKINNVEYILQTYNNSNPNSEEEFSHNWFEKNIGNYLMYGFRIILVKDRMVYVRKSFSNTKIENFTGKVSTINGKEFKVFGKSIYVSPSTKFYDNVGNSLTLDDFSTEDRIDIDYTHYNTEGHGDLFTLKNGPKFIALRITKLPHKEEINRYSEDVIKVSNDTIYTTSHILKLSSVQSKKDVNGDDITTDSLFAHYRAITFEVPSSEDRNEIRNVDFLHSTFNQKDSLHYRGSAIGRINSIQFPNLTVGANQYVVANGAKIRNKFGDTTSANETTIPNNSLVKVFYSRVENGSNIDYVVNFISLEDTSTFSSVFEPKPSVISVFPNPITNEQTTIKYESTVDEVIQLNILSIEGKTIFSQRMNVSFGKNMIPTNLKSIPNGQYFLELVSSNNKKRYTTSIQIMR